MSMQELTHVVETVDLLTTPCPSVKPELHSANYARHKKIRDDLNLFLDFMADKVLNPKMPSETGESFGFFIIATNLTLSI